MEPQRPISPRCPLNSPSEFIYASRSRSNISMPLGVEAHGLVSSAPPSRPLSGYNSLVSNSASPHASFMPYYNPPRFAEPWEPIQYNQSVHPTTPIEGARPRPFTYSHRPVSFREPCWGPRLGGEVAMNNEHLTPRIVEVGNDEDGPSLYATVPGLAVRDNSISPKTKVSVIRHHNNAKSEAQKKHHAVPVPRTLDPVVGPATQSVATTSHEPSPAVHTFYTPTGYVQTKLPVTPPHRQTSPTSSFSWDDEDALTDFSSSSNGTGVFGDHGNDDSTAGEANISSVVDNTAVEQADMIERICLEATKAYLRAHIANFRARTWTAYVCDGHSSGNATDSIAKNGTDVVAWEDDSTEAIRDRGSPVQRPQKSISSKRFRPYPMSARHVPFPTKDPFWSRPPQRRAPAPAFDLFWPSQSAPSLCTRPDSKLASGSHKRTRMPLAVPAIPPAMPVIYAGGCDTTAEPDILGLPCTDSLLANTTSICNLVWQKAARNRLVSLHAEIMAVVKMRRLLEAAETVVFESGVLRSMVNSDSECLTVVDGEDAGQGHQDCEDACVVMHRIFRGAHKVCSILKYETGSQGLKEMQKKQ